MDTLTCRRPEGLRPLGPARVGIVVPINSTNQPTNSSNGIEAPHYLRSCGYRLFGAPSDPGIRHAQVPLCRTEPQLTSATKGSVQESVRADQIIPVLVLTEQELESGPEQLGRILQYYVDNDDVCDDDFTGILVVNPSASSPEAAGVADDVAGPDLSRFSAVYHMVSEAAVLEGDNRLPSGPYFLSGPNLHQAWRLYPDELEAFTFGLIPDDPFSPQR